MGLLDLELHILGNQHGLFPLVMECQHVGARMFTLLGVKANRMVCLSPQSLVCNKESSYRGLCSIARVDYIKTFIPDVLHHGTGTLHDQQ